MRVVMWLQMDKWCGAKSLFVDVVIVAGNGMKNCAGIQAPQAGKCVVFASCLTGAAAARTVARPA
jgi:hypothetical protein